jgi:acetate---CoA ligase (ADP-forming)
MATLLSRYTRGCLNGQSTAPADLRPMLEARAVAVVGASERPGTPGEQMVLQLVRGGFEGPVYPVNPRYREVQGLACFPSLEDLPGEVDLALLGVRDEALEEQLRASAAVGARATVIFGSAHEDARPGVTPLTERLAAIAREAGMSICGANCMGFLNLDRRLRALAFHEREDLEPGPIAMISHSGSAFSALLHNQRGLRFNLAVSAGQELTTTMANYLAYAVEQPSTRVAALFLETVRHPAGFRAALRLAGERDVPVVALKVGRESAARELVQAHSGALAGEDAAYEAVFEAHGVIRVGNLDEMADVLEMLSTGRRAGAGGLASVHDSGGERAHLIDVAAEEGVRFAAISDATRRRLEGLLDPGLPAVNPLDAWGTGAEYERVFAECLLALLDDPDTAALAFTVDLGGEDLEPGYTRVALQVCPRTEKPFAVLSNLRSAVDQSRAAELRRAGVPMLEGTATGLAAFRALFELRDHRALPAPPPPQRVAGGIREAWRLRLERSEPWTELESLALVDDYGIPTVAAVPASSASEAVEAARKVGWPVALKATGVAHKTEAGGVRLGLRSPHEVEEAHADIASRLGPNVLVAAMAPPGVELALGVVRDPQFGPLVLVAAGGELVEVIRDRRMGLPPLDDTRARRLLDRLAVRPVLDGVRGRAPADLDAVVHAIVRLSALADDLGDLIEELDINPLICGPTGCVAADALIVPGQGGDVHPS